MGGKTMLGHWKRIAFLLVILGLAFVGVRELILSSALLGDEYSHQRVKEYWSNYEPTYADIQKYGECKECHREVYRKWVKGNHGPEDLRPTIQVSCEVCHGPAMEHLEARNKSSATPRVEKDTREMCALCHEDIEPRRLVPTKDLSRHGEGKDCIRCHSPPDP